MQIKLYTLRELKQMNAPEMEKDYVYGILKKDYKKLAKHPQKVVYKNKICYAIKDSRYLIPADYVKEINNED